jgi:diguanylate cyclase (GGDEF)-like protein
MNPRIRKRPTDAKPRPKVRPGIGLPLLISTPFLGMAVYASITREFGSLVLLSVLVIIAGLIAWLIFRIQKLEVERDRALAWPREAEWRASNLHLLQSSQVGPPYSVQHLHQLHDLQAEINALRARELVLEKQAHYDELTELPNRTLLRDRFSSAVERSKRSNTLFAVLMVDLNGFKVINDKYGHEVGDFVLVTTAHRILGALRASDTVARLGGDEFVLIVEGVSGSNDFEQVGKKLIEVLFEPINLPSGKIIGVGASLGMSVFPHDGADLTTLLAVADQAMYQCKATGLMRLY